VKLGAGDRPSQRPAEAGGSDTAAIMPEMLPSSPKIHNHASLRVDYWSFLVAADEATARGVTHWSARLLGEQLQIGFASVARIWRKWDLQPWRTETFKFSTDPELDAKIRDVVGLYVNPPDKAAGLRGRVVEHRGGGPVAGDAGDGDPLAGPLRRPPARRAGR
jgi:hypothetical protein